MQQQPQLSPLVTTFALVVGDLTRCFLAAVAYGVTGYAMLTGKTLPQEWWYTVFAVTGFFFAMEIPQRFKRALTVAMTAMADERERKGK